MVQQSSDAIKSYIAIGAFILQGVGSLYYFAQQNQKTVDKLEHLQAQLSKLENNQTLLTQVVTDVAVLKVQQASNTQSIAEIKYGVGVKNGR